MRFSLNLRYIFSIYCCRILENINIIGPYKEEIWTPKHWACNITTGRQLCPKTFGGRCIVFGNICLFVTLQRVQRHERAGQIRTLDSIFVIYLNICIMGNQLQYLYSHLVPRRTGNAHSFWNVRCQTIQLWLCLPLIGSG